MNADRPDYDRYYSLKRRLWNQKDEAEHADAAVTAALDALRNALAPHRRRYGIALKKLAAECRIELKDHLDIRALEWADLPDEEMTR